MIYRGFGQVPNPHNGILESVDMDLLIELSKLTEKDTWLYMPLNKRYIGSMGA